MKTHLIKDTGEVLLVSKPEELKEMHAKYYEKNKEQIDINNKEWYEKNKNRLGEKHICSCGGKYTFSHKNRHEKSKKHIKWVEENK